MDLIKEFLLEAFPNPERVGCPEEEILMSLAEGRLPLNHPARIHVSSCSECFAEYRGCCFEVEGRSKPKEDSVVEKIEITTTWMAIASALGARYSTATKAIQRVQGWITAFHHRYSR